MKLHRFYVSDKFELTGSLWIEDAELLHQWTRVLRFRPDREIVLFNSAGHEKLYKITKIEKTAVKLDLITEMKPKNPARNVYICFSMLKKDKNEWVMQKATELGVSHFLPIISQRTEKTGFNDARLQKIVVEASEQSGRADIPKIREPMGLKAALTELADKMPVYIAEQGGKDTDLGAEKAVAVFIGPEGGWTDEERQLFNDVDARRIELGMFTLRAETACVAAATYFGGLL